MSMLELTLAADHPAARGHFPGNAIIPGAVFLSAALSAIESIAGRELSPCDVRSAKFLYPARPGDCVNIEYILAGTRLSLVCSVAERTVLKAELTCIADEEDTCGVKAKTD